jgi:hypothetical protein
MNWNRGFAVIGWLLMIPVAIIALVILAFGFFEARKAYWDSRVKGMCDKEGGIKVFQVVQLDLKEYRKLLNSRNQIDLRNERFATPADSYAYSSATEYIVRGDPEIHKHVGRVLKWPEKVVLSEQIIFSRVGGDFPTGIGHRTYFSCPPPVETLFDKTFKAMQGAGS